MLIMLDYGHGGSDPGAMYKNRKESERQPTTWTSDRETSTSGGCASGRNAFN